MARPIALVGVGKIARDQHAPALAASAEFRLVATASPEGALDGVPAYDNLDAMLAAHGEIEVLSLCTPPRPRFRLAAQALASGRHVMLEKPPGATLAECRTLTAMARARGAALFAAWHSREAPAVRAAKSWLAPRRLLGVRVEWQENVRQWHPGQSWIFDAGGYGVFDPAINALSILTEIMPVPFHVTDATLHVPQNAHAPIRAGVRFHLPDDAPMTMELDFLKEGEQRWRIEATTDAGALVLSDGGARLSVDGDCDVGHGAADALTGEYPRLYAKLARLVEARAVDMDLAPLEHVADAFLLGRRVAAPAFNE